MDNQVEITGLTLQGLGKAKVAIGSKAFSLHVVGALVGEQVLLPEDLFFRSSRRPLLCRAESIVGPSQSRVAPLCPHFGFCGGCFLQHMSYEEQLEWKQARIKSLLSSFVDERTAWLPPIGSLDLWFYRNKMEFSFSQDASFRKFLGLYSMTKSGRIETIQECHIGPTWTSEMLSVIYRWWEETDLLAYHPYKDTGSLRSVSFRSSKRTKENMIILTVSGRPEWALSKSDCKKLVDSLLPMEQKYDMPFSCVLRIQQSIKGRPTEWYEMVLHGKGELLERYRVDNFGEIDLQFSPSSFEQPNSTQADNIYASALDMLHLHPEDVLWDLFCGVGGFGLLASPFVKKAVGIELSSDAVYDATCNKKRIGRDNFYVEQGDVFEMVSSRDASDRLPLPTKVVVDPPRSGLGSKVVDLLDLVSPRRIAYVSCNPETQAKDLALFHSKGWRICSSQMVDQFPHTYHVENIVLLKRL